MKKSAKIEIVCQKIENVGNSFAKNGTSWKKFEKVGKNCQTMEQVRNRLSKNGKVWKAIKKLVNKSKPFSKKS